MGRELEATAAEEELLRRLDDYVQLHNISLNTFWNTPRLCLALDQFLKLLDNIRFPISSEDIDALQAHAVEFVNLEVVLKGVSTWQQQEGSVASFITKQHTQPSPPTPSNASRWQLPTADPTAPTASRMKAGERAVRREVQLNQTLLRTKNESDYELTMRVGEANDICKRLKRDCSYLIDAADGEAQIVEINAKTGTEGPISRKLFDKAYEQLKMATLARLEEGDGTMQQDLKKTLVEVMFLSSQLQQQIKILKEKGVAH